MDVRVYEYVYVCASLRVQGVCVCVCVCVCVTHDNVIHVRLQGDAGRQVCL